jgi:pimeloyl-ACP methyl ester carboxylesterase
VSVAPSSTTALTQHKTVQVDGLEIFYREAGDPANPTLLLLHGLPTSSRMFRNLIPRSPTASTSLRPTTRASGTARSRPPTSSSTPSRT